MPPCGIERDPPDIPKVGPKVYTTLSASFSAMLSVVALSTSFSAAPAKDVVMYHVNPKRFGPIPLNMDTADEAGDLFFEMMEVLTVPLACTDPTRDPGSGFECNNPEAYDPTDVVNKLTLTVTGGYSGYAMCNIGRCRCPACCPGSRVCVTT